MIWTFLLKPFAAVKRFVITHWRIVLDLSLIIGTSLLARWFFLRFMPSTTVSGDMYEWVRIGQVLADGKNPYVVTDTLSYWPPFWIHTFCFSWPNYLCEPVFHIFGSYRPFSFFQKPCSWEFCISFFDG